MRKDHDRVERQARRFVEQLRPSSDCPEPLPCGTCFPAFTASLDAATLEHLSNKCPEFYDVLLGIVLREPVLSEEECAVLCARIVAYETTSCPNCAARSEGPGERNAPRLESLFDVVYSQCCLTIAMCLDPSEKEKAYSRMTKRPFRSGYWPDTPARLLPLGAEQAIHRLVRSATWYRGAVSLLSAMLQRYRYHVFREIIKDSLLVRRTISVLEEAAKDARSALDIYHSSSSTPRLPVPTPSSDSDAFVLNALEPYDEYAFLLRNIAFGLDSQSLDLPRFMLCYKAPLYRAIVGAIECLSDITAWVPRLPDLAISIFEQLDADDRRDPPMFIRTLIAEGIKRSEDMHAVLAHLLPDALKRRACSGPTCGTHVHETGNSRTFEKCGRCKAVHYCSKECQRADWRWESEPHKEMCDILCEIFAITTRETVATASMDAIASAWRDGALPPERARRLIHWISGREPENIPAVYTEVFQVNQSIAVPTDG